MMGYYKLMVILFNVTPYLVLRFVRLDLQQTAERNNLGI